MAEPGAIRVLYFAWLRDRLGTSQETLTPPPEVATVAALRDWIAARSPRHAAGFAQGTLIRCAVNQHLAGPEQPVRPGDEVAFFPPVTGG